MPMKKIDVAAIEATRRGCESAAHMSDRPEFQSLLAYNNASFAVLFWTVGRLRL